MTATPETIPPRVAVEIERAIMGSFLLRPLAGGRITASETQIRFRMCEEIWQVLRLEHGRSLSYICDHLFPLLIDVIDTGALAPSNRNSWTIKSRESQEVSS